jgi:ribose 5-phosphate isomerase B
MRISIGADHRGYLLKSQLIPWLESEGHEVIDEGSASTDSVDYPDYATKVAQQVSHHAADVGILACATGIGMCITANKVHGVRATICADEDTARLSRQHNNVNVICLSGDRLDLKQAKQIVDAWLKTPFAGGRHARRVEKIEQLERTECQN